MIRLLKILWFGHVHEWEIKETWPMKCGWFKDDGAKGNRYMCRCVSCGVMRKFDCW